jgi:hypothetical protein
MYTYHGRRVLFAESSLVNQGKPLQKLREPHLAHAFISTPLFRGPHFTFLCDNSISNTVCTSNHQAMHTKAHHDAVYQNLANAIHAIDIEINWSPQQPSRQRLEAKPRDKHMSFYHPR